MSKAAPHRSRTSAVVALALALGCAHAEKDAARLEERPRADFEAGRIVAAIDAMHRAIELRPPTPTSCSA
jgi:hypothetical protein